MGSKKKKRVPQKATAPEPVAPAPFAAAPVSLVKPQQRRPGFATGAQGLGGGAAATAGLKTLLGQ